MSRNPIVAGTDGSPRAELAVDKAGELAKALGVPVHVACVPGALEANEWPARVSAQQVVAAAADRLRSRGITVETHLPKDEGDPALALVALAEHEDAQMLVVGNKGMTGIRRLLGSFPNRVSHRARCDVLIIPAQPQSLPELSGGSIVVGADGSVGARPLDEGIRLSKALGGDLHIVSVSKAPNSSESALALAAGEAAAEGVTAITHAREGDPAAALFDVADNHDAAIVVVASKGMHAGEREWFGNITDRISHRGTRSVLIVYGEGPRGSDREATVTAAGLPGEDASR